MLCALSRTVLTFPLLTRISSRPHFPRLRTQMFVSNTNPPSRTSITGIAPLTTMYCVLQLLAPSVRTIVLFRSFPGGQGTTAYMCIWSHNTRCHMVGGHKVGSEMDPVLALTFDCALGSALPPFVNFLRWVLLYVPPQFCHSCVRLHLSCFFSCTRTWCTSIFLFYKKLFTSPKRSIYIFNFSAYRTGKHFRANRKQVPVISTLAKQKFSPSSPAPIFGRGAAPSFTNL